MRKRLHSIQLIVQLIIISIFNLQLFQLKVNEVYLPKTGMQMLGNHVVITLIFSVTLLVLIGNLFGLLGLKVYKKFETVMIVSLNIQMILAALLITLYSEMVTFLGMIHVVLYVITVYIQFRIKE